MSTKHHAQNLILPGFLDWFGLAIIYKQNQAVIFLNQLHIFVYPRLKLNSPSHIVREQKRYVTFGGANRDQLNLTNPLE